jgi:hypothetical protein
MTRARILQEVRQMQFEELYGVRMGSGMSIDLLRMALVRLFESFLLPEERNQSRPPRLNQASAIAVEVFMNNVG